MSKTVLITGATRGIGRHASLYLARRGHTVIATGRPSEALATLQSEARDLNLHTVLLDVTDPTTLRQAQAQIANLGLKVEVLINNAGFGCMGAILDIDQDEVRRQYETNVFGLLEVIRTFAPSMIRDGRGRIINVSSIGGRMTLPLMGSYTSTKYAVESISDALRAELAPFGVQVVLVEPGAIKTNFTETASASIDPAWMQTSPWRDVYPHSKEITERFERRAPDPTPVSWAFARAIESKRPRARYVAPRYNAALLWLKGALPTWAVDKLMSRMVGLHRARPQMATAHTIPQVGAA
jgi:short-subunit dehydrogenase